MKKLILIIFSLVFLLSNVIADDNFEDEFTEWLIKNNHTQYLKQNECYGCDEGTATLKCFDKDGVPKKNVGCMVNGEEAIPNLMNTI